MRSAFPPVHLGALAEAELHFVQLLQWRVIVCQDEFDRTADQLYALFEETVGTQPGVRWPMIEDEPNCAAGSPCADFVPPSSTVSTNGSFRSIASTARASPTQEPVSRKPTTPRLERMSIRKILLA